jgi:hypothetical protein
LSPHGDSRDASLPSTFSRRPRYWESQINWHPLNNQENRLNKLIAVIAALAFAGTAFAQTPAPKGEAKGEVKAEQKKADKAAKKAETKAAKKSGAKSTEPAKK